MKNSDKIAYNCKKATFLIEKNQLTSLTMREKMELKLHLAGCSICRMFERQSILINKQVRNIFQSAAKKEYKLDQDFKTKLQNQIDRKLNKI